MYRIISIVLCFALALPTLETVVSEMGLVDFSEHSLTLADTAENEAEESDKEEKKEKELEEFDLLKHVPIHLSSDAFGWHENSHLYRSLVSEIPSPPPDYLA